jgi:membrane protease YdiL (CAAX protease family)
MKHKPLVVYLLLVVALSGAFIAAMKLLGQQGVFLASFYMLGPAIAALITRAFFYEKRFRDANLKIGKAKHYLTFWIVALAITALSAILYTLLGSVRWDLSGQLFLDQLSQQMASTGQDINDLPPGFTPQTMLILYAIGGLTVFNIFPGIIAGFGEEFGWRGFMFPQLYTIGPWPAFLIGGLIWYAWHIPLALVFPQTQAYTFWQMLINVVVLAGGSLCTFAFLAYVYVKSESVWVASFAHIAINNASRSLSYFLAVEDQLLANVGLMATMLIVVVLLFFTGEFAIFRGFPKDEPIA